ncbi:DUF6602 domain-containing protein [Methanosarcina sp. T3]|uniref:DUF6602 domain-containing protein n=1 Tax=Methanosarcina sp. T3 TaxID=3439062 RepID=UPI003F869F7E
MASQDFSVNMREIFKNISNSMRAELEITRSAIPHSGEKGQINEEVFRNFLSKYLPKSLDISTGFVIDTNGGISRQLDIIISDAAKTPIFFENGKSNKKIRVIPVECVYAIIEVKTKLTKQEIDSCIVNMESVKKLEKKAYVLPPRSIRINILQYGKEWDICPVNYYVFAYEADNLQVLRDYLLEKVKEKDLPVHLRVDTICVLNEGLITNWLPKISKFESLPEEGSDLIVISTEDALLLFYLITSRHFFQTYLPCIMPVHYAPFIPLEISFPKEK